MDLILQFRAICGLCCGVPRRPLAGLGAMTTTLNFAAFDGDAAYSSPIAFREVWANIMVCPLKREWAFNQHLPTASELLRGRDNQPFSKSVFPDDSIESRMEELFCTTRFLADGTNLGFSLNSACIDFIASLFAPFESSFGDHQLGVGRLISGAMAGRLYMMEFCWLKSGALTVRFGPYLSLNTAKRNELRAGYTMYAFLPGDAAMLSAMALCPGEPGQDFVNARFDRIFVSEDWYMLKLMDTYFQSSCVFCGSRGFAVCGCPLPMRRRCLGWAPQMIGYKVREGKTWWEELATAKTICANQSTMLFNVTKAPHSRHARVMGSGMFPFHMTIQMNVKTSECLQMHLGFTGQSVNARRTVLMPFRLKESGKRALMRPPSSLEDIVTPTPGSSVDSKKPVSSLCTSSSSDELISLIRGTCKRPRVEGTAEQAANSLSNTVASEEAGSSGEIDTVTDATTIIVNTMPVVPEVLSSNEKSSNASTGSRAEVGNRVQAPAQPKVFACPECGVHIKNKRYNLKRHIQVVHQKLRRFGCTLPNCEQRFQTKVNLKRHLSKVHKLGQTVRERRQPVQQEQPESRQTMRQAPISDNLYSTRNDGSGEQQTVPDTLFDLDNDANVEQQGQQTS